MRSNWLLMTSTGGLRDGPLTHPLRSTSAYFCACMGERHIPQETIWRTAPHEAGFLCALAGSLAEYHGASVHTHVSVLQSMVIPPVSPPE